MRERRDELGAHMSIAGGLYRALERGCEVGCGAVQIFLRNQRQWRAAPLSEADVRAFRGARRRTRITQVFAHAAYLINLSTADGAAYRRAVNLFTDELERAEALALSCVVIHPGSHLGAGRASGLACATRALNEALRRTAGYRVKVALENSAGAGHAIGRSLEDLSVLLERSSCPERLGVCIDTCHLFAAGYDIRTAAGWSAAVDVLVARVGVRGVLAFHLNDAASGLASGLDRHEHIGRGQVGLVPFRALLNDPRFAAIPKVLETPKDPEPRMDRANLARLRRLRCPIDGWSRRHADTAR